MKRNIIKACQTTVNATLIGPDTGPAPYAYLQFDLTYCGYNIPAVPGFNQWGLQVFAS
jgi:hypothetical protein